MPQRHIRTPEEIEQYRWLISSDGAEVLQRVEELTCDGTPDLKIGERLRRSYSAHRVALAMTQRDLRLRGREKFPQANRLFFTREGLEQATSWRIAIHRASRFADTLRAVDLCCGVGGDLMSLATITSISQLSAVDLDPVHLMLAAKNVAIVEPQRDVLYLEGEVHEIDLAHFTGAFIDPARRSTSRRLGGMVTEPPLDWAVELSDRIPNVGIKAAPGLPHDLIPAGWELETISLDAELKEAVLWSPGLATGPRTATVIAGDGVHQLRSVPDVHVACRSPEPGQWLLDPNPAITRAGLVQDLARMFSCSMIDEKIAFLVSDVPVHSPFARTLPIIDAGPWHERRLRKRLRELDAGPVDVRRRGLAGDVDVIARRLRGNGSRPLTVAMTRVHEEPWAVICDPAELPPKG